VIGKLYLARQAATLLKFAQSTQDPATAAALVEKAAALKYRSDQAMMPDLTPVAPDVEPPSAL
jgi:hypothetical protein